jgi:hypothetical protein
MPDRDKVQACLARKVNSLSPACGAWLLDCDRPQV